MKNEGWDDIRLVVSDHDLESVYRFRYSIYVSEMRRAQHDADHVLRRVKDPLDEFALNFAAFRGSDVVGAVRVNHARDGRLDYYDDFYRMGNTVPHEHPHSTSIVTRLMISAPYRRGTLGYRLCHECFKRGLADDITIAFIDCNDHLVPFFEGLGFRSYMGNANHKEYGWVTPMMLRLRDEAYLSSLSSPFSSTLRRWNQAHTSRRDLQETA